MTAPDDVPFRLVIHGGAGAINRSRLTAEREAVYRQVLTTIIKRRLCGA
jgi:beta-aspartyl-peptidase (threonine type)